MWSWKNWLGYAGVFAAFVLISFIVEWSIRTKGKVFWLDGLIRWWADFVMFGWVKDYQTLLGGMFALGAGAFVMLAALYQRRTAEKDALRVKRERLEVALSRAAVGYRRLLRQINHSNFDEAMITVQTFEPLIVELVSEAGSLANWLLRVNSTVETHLRKAQAGGAGKAKAKQVVLGNVFLATEYLSLVRRLVAEDGSFIHVPRDRQQTKSRMQDHLGLDMAEFEHAEWCVS